MLQSGATKETRMIFYVYYDAYGHPVHAVSETELGETFQNDPDRFLQVMASRTRDAASERVTGHVGVVRVEDETDLKDFLQSLGDEITGFYGCEMASRPYNF